MHGKLILGRDPALWLAALQALLAILVGFKLDWLTAEHASLWLAVTNGILMLVMAWATRPMAPTLFTNVFSIVMTLLAAYGLHVSQEMVGTINAAIVAVIILVARGQISPTATAHLTGVLGDRVTTEPRSFRED